MNILQDKVALVTGASSGIGRAAAKLFAKEGAKVIVAARRQKELDTLVDEIIKEGGSAIALAGDVQDESYAKALVDLAIKEYGGLDIAFNNAGTLGASGATSEITLEGWNDTVNTNLYKWPMGFSRFVLRTVDPGYEISDYLLIELESAIGSELRVIHQMY